MVGGQQDDEMFQRLSFQWWRFPFQLTSNLLATKFFFFSRKILWWINLTWWRHQMETFSALLTICAGNSPVPGEFPAQRPMTRRFDVFFDLRLNKWLSKQSWGWWFETLSRPLWCHRNEICCCWSEPVQSSCVGMSHYLTPFQSQPHTHMVAWFTTAIWQDIVGGKWIRQHWQDGDVDVIFNPLRLRQNGHQCPDDIFKCIFLNENI